MSIILNGSSQNLISSSTSFGTSSASISGWINPSRTSNYRDIMSVSIGSSSTTPPIRMYLNSSRKLVVEINIVYYILIVPVLGKITLTSSSSITLNKWTHVGLVVDNTTNTIKMFLDGVANTSTSYSGNYYNVGDTIVLGANKTGTSSYNNYFSGSLEDFRFYSRPLTNFEMQTIFNALGRDGIMNSLEMRLKMNSGKKGTTVSTSLLCDYPNKITFTNRNSPTFGDQFLSFLRDK